MSSLKKGEELKTKNRESQEAIKFYLRLKKATNKMQL